MRNKPTFDAVAAFLISKADKSSGFSAEDIANELGISRQTVSRVLNNNECFRKSDNTLWPYKWYCDSSLFGLTTKPKVKIGESGPEKHYGTKPLAEATISLAKDFTRYAPNFHEILTALSEIAINAQDFSEGRTGLNHDLINETFPRIENAASLFKAYAQMLDRIMNHETFGTPGQWQALIEEKD